jgi:diguanylate cyclase
LATIHRARLGGFFLAFLSLGSHLLDREVGPLVWLLLGLSFLVYPHLVRAVLKRGRPSAQASLNWLCVDSGLLGVWSAALGYPLWISFTLLICHAAAVLHYMGRLATVLIVLSFVLPGMMWLGLSATALQPLTGPLTTGLCMLSLTLYLYTVSDMAFRRIIELRKASATLRVNEQALLDANAALQLQMAEVNTLQAQLREQANRDALTGLYNRRYLDSTLPRELARCERDGEALCLMLIDIDYFKKINDTLGHPAGDAVLRHLAELLTARARVADMTCRYGGEEFVVVMPGMSLATACERAEAWREDFAGTDRVVGDAPIRATLSVGIVCHARGSITAQQLIQRADQALYRAKAEGRNRVAVWDAQSPAAAS